MRQLLCYAILLLSIGCTNFQSFEALTGTEEKAKRITTTSNNQTIICSNLSAFNGTTNDAAQTIIDCIQQAGTNYSVLLPPGKYYVSKSIGLWNKSNIFFGTQGKYTSSTPCAETNHGCAEIVASTNFSTSDYYLMAIGGSNVKVDHIVFDGNKSVGKTPLVVFNVVSCNGCAITNNIIKNGGTQGLTSPGVSNTTIKYNKFVDNGFHHIDPLWSDGLTILDGENNIITNNYLRDNTDVDFVIGGCKNCQIQNNTIVHSGDFKKGSFAAMQVTVMAKWDGSGYAFTSGNFAGTDISNINIDCGGTEGCGFGLLIGSHPWGDGDTTGGISNSQGTAIHDITIKNAQQGFMIDAAHDMNIYNISVQNSTTASYTKCGIKGTTKFKTTSEVYNMYLYNPAASLYDTDNTWHGCVPNHFTTNNAPTELSPNNKKDVSTSTVRLKWQPVTGATSYSIRVNDLTTPSLQYTNHTCPGYPHYACFNVTTNYADIPVYAGHSYSWWVHANSIDGYQSSAGGTATFSVIEQSIAGVGTNLTSTFTELKKYHSYCSSSAPWSLYCFSAINRYCQVNGYTSGYGPNEHYYDTIQFTCLNSNNAKIMTTTFTELSNYNSACSNAQALSYNCLDAINKFANANGYSGAFGPIEISNSTNVQLVTIKSNTKSTITFAQMANYQPYCNSSDVIYSVGCASGAHRICKISGYTTGIITGGTSSTITFKCL